MIDQTDTQWPLRQISSKDQNSPNYASKAEAGEGTTVFVLDTGIEIEHEELEGRATWGVNTLDDIKSDDTGHGTHVAGIIGSRTYGVAKKTQMVGVRVLGGPAADGCSCSIIPGLAWAVNEIKTNSSLQNKSVINLSFGVHPANLTQGVTDVFAQAFAAAFDVLPSLVVVAAAGNDDSGDLVLPAALPRVCAVGSTDLHSRKSSFSNFGPRVDVRAPGSGIISLGTEHMTPTKATSGTPMAAPFISGLAAYLISLSSSPEEQKDICKMVKEETIKNLDLFSASDHGTDTTNKFAYNGKDQQLRKRGPARQTKKDLSTTDITELGAFNMTGIQQLPCPATDCETFCGGNDMCYIWCHRRCEQNNQQLRKKDLSPTNIIEMEAFNVSSAQQIPCTTEGCDGPCNGSKKCTRWCTNNCVEKCSMDCQPHCYAGQKHCIRDCNECCRTSATWPTGVCIPYPPPHGSATLNAGASVWLWMASLSVMGSLLLY